jgi:hypothetical protein
VTRNVRNQNPHMFLIDDNEVIKISRHRAHRNVARNNFQTMDLRELLREDGQLDLSRHLELIIYVQELPSQLLAGLAEYKVGMDACSIFRSKLQYTMNAKDHVPGLSRHSIMK